MEAHNGYKPYECQSCGKSFTRGGDLKRHVRTHTGEKLYTCQLCQKSFTQGTSLKRHMQSHFGYKPHRCHLCEKSFTKGNDLKRHMRTHTGEKPYECQLCQKSFTQGTSLKRHTRTHTVEKPYKSQSCKKSFTRRSGLKSRMRSHAGEAPDLHEVCNKRFKVVGSLKRYRRTHAAEKYHNRYKHKISSSLKQPQSIERESLSTVDQSVLFTALTGAGAFYRPNERLSRNMFADSSVEISSLCYLEEYLSISEIKSPGDAKPFVERPFGCGICGEMLEIEKEFHDHCSGHRFSPPDDLLICMQLEVCEI